jgi:hypothetical protein
MRRVCIAAFGVLVFTLLLNNAGCLDPCGTCPPPPGMAFAPGGLLNYSRAGHTATPLVGQSQVFHPGEVLIVGGRGNFVLNSGEIYDPLTGSFSFLLSSMNEPRVGQTATSLQTGDVLIAGGRNATVSDTAELYKFATGSFIEAGTMNVPRSGHAATLLSDGSVLITGGSRDLSAFQTNLGALSDAELYIPVSGFQIVQSMTSSRSEHTATLLMNGSVLIAGGFDDKGRTLSSAEIYDPVTHTFSSIMPMKHPRRDHTAILMLDGKVLLAGGWDAQNNPVNTTEIYDSSGFLDGPMMNRSRAYLSSSLLNGGAVLVAGGDANESAEVFSGGQFTELATSDFSAGAANAAATIANGDVLVTGGGFPVDKIFGYTSSNDFANLFLSDGSGLLHVGFLKQSRSGHTATTLPATPLLPDGTVLVVGGEDVQEGPTFDEVYDSSENKSSIIQQGLVLVGHTATTLFTSGPNEGSVLIAGGTIGQLNTMSPSTCQTQPVVPYPNEWIYNPLGQAINPGYTNAQALNTARYMHTATLLTNGTVLVTGGIDEAGNVLNNAEIYDPSTDRWSTVPAKMIVRRQSHAAALLNDGTVLIAGGCGSSGERLSSAEIYDPNTQMFTKKPDMRSARANFTLTALEAYPQTSAANVLVAGGSGNASAELYDAIKGKFVTTGSLTDTLFGPTATLLANGKVLITSGGSANAELYDPTVNTFSLAGRMTIDRLADAAALLPDQHVLIVGGFENSPPVTTSTTEIYLNRTTPTPTPTP